VGTGRLRMVVVDLFAEHLPLFIFICLIEK